MFRFRKLTAPVAPPPNPIGKRLAEVTPAGTLLKHQELVDKPGTIAPGRTTLDYFDVNGDGKYDHCVHKIYDAADPQKLKSVSVMVNAPGQTNQVAGGESFEDRNADGIVDGYSVRTPGATPAEGRFGVGELSIWDSNLDGKVDRVSTWGSSLDPALAERFVGTKLKDVLFHSQTDTDGDGKLDFEEIRNPFKPPTLDPSR